MMSQVAHSECLRESILRLPIGLGRERHDILPKLVPMLPVAFENYDLNTQSGGIIHRTQGECQMIWCSRIRPINWASAPCAKGF